MYEQTQRVRQSGPESFNYGLSSDARAAIMLGMVALVFGFGAVAAAAYVGLFLTVPSIALPGGLDSVDPRLLAMIMAASGTVTTLLGGLTLYKSQEM